MQRSLGILALCVGCGAAQSPAPVQPAALTVDQTSIGFATVAPGDASAETLLHVTNPGGAATSALAIALTGTDAGAFAVTADTCSGQPLAPAATCEIHLVFRPSQEGQLAATLQVSAGSLGATVPLGGRAQGSARLAVSSHSFAGVDVGQTSSASVTVTNTGTMSSGAVSFDPAGDVASFTLGGDCAGRALAPSESCTLQVTFAPRDIGVKVLTLGVSAAHASTVPLTFDGYGTRRVLLTVNIQGDGEVMVAGTRCAAPGCNLPFTIGGAAVRPTLSASAGTRSLFSQWSGACGGTVPSCDVSLTANATVTARFVPAVMLSVDATSLAGGQGSLHFVPGTACDAPCSTNGLVPQGQPILLAAVAGAESQFRWTGACRGTDKFCQFTPSNDTHVGLVFNGANYVFVTSQAYPTNLGIGGYDSICNARAAAAGLPGPFVAWLSTQATPAWARVAAARGFIRVDGQPFADTLGPGAPVYFPPSLDEFGQLRDRFTRLAMTGTGYYGETDASANCSDWTVAGNTALKLGDPMTGMGAWTGWAWSGCASNWLVYCVGTGINRPLQRERPAGRLAFVSAESIPSGQGLQRADQLCAGDARAAGLSGSFKALLPVDGASAVSRFDLTAAPWMRPDGTPIVAKAADLGSGTLIAPIDQTATGAYDFSSSLIWAGAPAPGYAGTAASTCASWTSTDSSLSTSGAIDVTIEQNWYGIWNVSCDSWGRVICLQE